MVERKAHVLSIRVTERLYSAIEAAARRGLRPVGQQAVLMLAEALVATGDLPRSDMEEALLRAPRSAPSGPQAEHRARGRAAPSRVAKPGARKPRERSR